jgi:hypothetical protein
MHLSQNMEYNSKCLKGKIFITAQVISLRKRYNKNTAHNDNSTAI